LSAGLGRAAAVEPSDEPPAQNRILAIRNAIPTGDLAGRIALRTLARRGSGYADEVRRLLDAALVVMSRCGTDRRPRVSDIVREARLSNEAFYRHFRSKDDLVVALVEEGALRLRGYLEHQMAKAPSPEDRVRCWVTGVLAQAHGEVAATTLSVIWNGGGLAGGLAGGGERARAPLAALLEQPFAELGSAAPAADATLAAHAVLGRLSDYLWRRHEPTPAEIDLAVAFCLRAGRS
jgi:AcrR family transcriptional regulator